MGRKEATTKGDLLTVIDLLEDAGITYWIDGGWYEFEKDFFGNAVFEGKTIPCISVKGQKFFHSGYDLRDKDKHDILILENVSE
ncbi:hypothetical protein CE91St62_09740 [Lachnospiraceae bacterium]|nr:hypothetical protein [Extibacter sp. GGCC_0201]BDF32908.1 hypothetical protein CE91St61_09830 [Lachnospiraceae bacterium]BDF36913.1 hypothetical protein CE91St62_09740 [Lachnospiraceae bacterium]